MGIGSFAMACLLFAVSAGAAPDEWHMNQTQFKIPIRIKPDQQADIKSLVLYYSRDEGATWNQGGTATPDKDGFLFDTKGDGKYWFKVAVINNKGVQDPTNIFTAPVGQKIILDTVKPEIRVGAERDGDGITVGWEINEQYPRPESLRVDYRAADAADGLWTGVPLNPGQNKVSFKPPTAGTLAVRVQIEDQAGNVGIGQATVAGIAPAAPPTSPTPIVQNPPPSPVIQPPVAGNPPPPANPGSNWNTTPGSPVGVPHSTEVTPVGIQQPAPQPLTGGAGVYPAAALTMRGALPPLLLVNKETVRLDFDVAKVGPSGVSSVEVYLSTDEGQTWQGYPAETAPPQPASSAEASKGMKGGVLVKLPNDDTVYSFYLVVKSGAGLGKKGPQPGDAPQIRIERDTKAPIVHWLKPMPDQKYRDSLVLNWEATDKNIAVNPVTLEWSVAKQGAPWQSIGEPSGGTELPNTGHYTWHVPPEVKQPSVFFRLTVRDTAGNTTVFVTEEPELVDLSVPEITTIHLGNH